MSLMLGLWSRGLWRLRLKLSLGCEYPVPNPMFDVGYGSRARRGMDLVGAFIAVDINVGSVQGLIDGFMNSIVSFVNSVQSSSRGFRALLLIYTNQCPETTTKTLNQCIRLGRVGDCLGGECGDAFIIEGSAKVGIDVIKGLIMRKAPQTGSAGNPQPMFRALRRWVLLIGAV